MATERPTFLCRKCGSTNPQVWTDVVNDDDGAADTLSARQTRCQAAGTNYAEEPSQNRPAVNHVGPASSAMTGSCGSPSTRGRGCDSRFHYERFAELPRTCASAATEFGRQLRPSISFKRLHHRADLGTPPKPVVVVQRSTASLARGSRIFAEGRVRSLYTCL